MAIKNGHKAIPDLVEEYQQELLAANQQFADALVAVGKGYQQAAETAIRFTFAQWKALNNVQGFKPE